MDISVVECFSPITQDFLMALAQGESKSKEEILSSYYKEVAEQVYMYMDFTQDALYGTYKDLYGINIVTDARHGWRKNAKDTSVVAVGDIHTQLLTVSM